MESDNIYEKISQPLFMKNWSSWFGIPGNLTDEIITAYKDFSIIKKDRDRLGQNEYDYTLIRWPDSENIIRVWFEHRNVLAIDTPVNQSITPENINILGDPDMQLDYFFNVLKITGGERVYVKRGLTLFTDKQGTRVHHVLLYHITDFSTYIKRYRLRFAPLIRKPLKTAK